MQQIDLFGNPVDVFKSAKARYGVWPVTVWPIDSSDKYTKELKTLIGDDPNDLLANCSGEATQSRTNSNTAQRSGSKIYSSPNAPGQTTHTSIFNPAVAAWLLNCYAPDGGVCLDPFAGGGTRAIMAAKHGLEYIGLEIRPEEVAAVRRRCDMLGAQATIIEDDARNCGTYGPASFCLTCPPYYDLEVYSGGGADLSMLPTYKDFLDAIYDVVAGTRDALIPGATSCWVIGLHRSKDGGLLPLHHDVARIHRELGFLFREEIILHHANNGAIQRIGNFDKGQHRLIRVHEYALVFTRP